MIHDVKRWDKIHKRIVEEEDDGHSVYAQEKEKLFPRGAIICDFGGGTGADALYFLKNGHSVILLDISEFALKVAQKKARDAGFDRNLVVKQVDFGLHQLPLQKESVDVAFSRISLNYFPANETSEIFSQIYSALKPSGSAYITMKSPEDAEEMEYLTENSAVYEQSVFIDNGQLRSRFTIDELKQIVSNAGIANYQVHPYKEMLGPDKKGHRQVLHLNEIIFQKI
jgi:ubiquinone/menaquinone biosynthesis C-methylase UbiE